MNLFVDSLKITSDVVVVKPNWVDGRDGTHTDAKILDMLLTSLARKVIIVESYSYWRTQGVRLHGKHEFPLNEGNSETGKKHWDFFKEQDKLFLESEGLFEVLKRHRAEYLNITNEIWQGHTADPAQIKEITENKYEPVHILDMYKNVPQKLLDIRGSDFISFSKAKKDSTYGASLSIKNIFGLIPDPTRYEKYHGGDPELLLCQSIVDINKIYQSLFNITFVVEGVYEGCLMDWDTGQSFPFYDWGIIGGGRDGLEVDSIFCKLLGSDFKAALSNLKNLYKENFGGKEIVDIKSVPEEYFQREGN